MRSNASASWPSTLTSSCSSARYMSLKLLISMATLSLIRDSEMHRKLPGDGTEKRDAGHPVLMSCFAHGAGDAARLAWGNRATVYALHLEYSLKYSGANFATAEFPANGGLRKRQKPL